MHTPAVQRILTINTGSSSLKAAVYALGPGEERSLFGEVDRIGRPTARLRLRDAQGSAVIDEEGDYPDHATALAAVLKSFQRHCPKWRPDAVGHRVVHGGTHTAPQRITPDLIALLERLTPLAPDHMHQALRAIEATRRAYPDVPQVACFDTTFHRHMPRLAQIYPLPRHLADAGVIRYGFHGLSYSSILEALRTAAPEEAGGRIVIAHLGSGASMAAVRGGIGVDTTMGFTPAGGLMMGTRPGDLDPGVLLYLSSEQGMGPVTLDELVNQRSGLLGVSGTTADMRDLLSQEAADGHAAEAIALFCYLARKSLGALAAVLGGLDTLVFTGGIGEHAAPIRRRIAEGLDFLGVRIDPRLNQAHAPVISPDGRSPTVRVMHADEELMIARQTKALMERKG